jgi:hypothetical protein
MKKQHLKHQGDVTHTFSNNPRSKALESVCLFRSDPLPIATQSPRGGGEGERLGRDPGRHEGILKFGGRI